MQLINLTINTERAHVYAKAEDWREEVKWRERRKVERGDEGSQNTPLSLSLSPPTEESKKGRGQKQMQ